MTQVAEGSSGARPSAAVPLRVHDLLLGLAGRLDDDALTEARELLASIEVDRCLELVVGCLVAGRIPVSGEQRTELDALLALTHGDRDLVGRLVVGSAMMAHRFTSGVDRRADQGVAEAAGAVLDVLPDIRSVWCVWRTTPAGAVSGPVPKRIVLVGVGPAGFPPATAYRLGHALRRAGIDACVEVLHDGAELGNYHSDAMALAIEVPLRAEVDSRSDARVEPPVHQPVSPPAPQQVDQPVQPRVEQRREPEPAPTPGAAESDEQLSDQEKALLAQLQEELVRRESGQDQPSPEPLKPETGRGRHGGQPGTGSPFSWPASINGAATVVNGIPPVIE